MCLLNGGCSEVLEPLLLMLGVDWVRRTAAANLHTTQIIVHEPPKFTVTVRVTPIFSPRLFPLWDFLDRFLSPTLFLPPSFLCPSLSPAPFFLQVSSVLHAKTHEHVLDLPFVAKESDFFGDAQVRRTRRRRRGKRRGEGGKYVETRGKRKKRNEREG